MCGFHYAKFLIYYFILSSLFRVVLTAGNDIDDRYCLQNDDGSTDCQTPFADHFKLFRLEGHQVGHMEKLHNIIPDRILHMKTLSLKPLLFEIPDLLSEVECAHLMTAASESASWRESYTVNQKRDNKISLIDSDNDKQLDINEMILTVENAFDMYLDQDDVIQMYQTLGLDTNHDNVISQMELEKLKPAKFREYFKGIFNENPVKRSRHSSDTWFTPYNTTDKVLLAVLKKIKTITKLPEVLMKKSDFQVVKYKDQGHYNAHLDSSSSTELPCCPALYTGVLHVKCRICRFLTTLLYLNDVEEGGETAFPVADNDTFNSLEFHKSRQNDLQQNCHKANVIVKPARGKALIWYNHHVDGLSGWVGEVDTYAWHGACPVVKGTKWVANSWINLTSNKGEDLKKDEGNKKP